jgi:16S rRNA (uracil1498-N3)-methyltransferase
MLTDALRANETPQSLTLAIGPEGGWTPEELHTFATAQFISCSLGETILRAETGAIAALAIARAEQ